MRLRSKLLPLLPLLILAPLSCRSTDVQDDAENGAGGGQMAESTDAMDVGARAGGPVEAGARIDPQELDDDLDRLSRRQGQRGFLASRSIEEGDALLERADFEGALAAYSYALQIDPTSQEARERIQKVEALMGDRFAVAADALEDEVAREMVRRAQARIAAEKASTLGDVALRRGDYDQAIAQYREAELILRYHPLVATESLDEQIVSGKLASALDLQEEARAEARRREQNAAQMAREQRERREREYRENKLITLFNEANGAYLSENYRRAEQLCQQILMEDPGNEAAMHLRDIAREARHDQTATYNRQHYREQWIRTFEDLRTMNVVQTESIVFDDLRRWRDVMQRTPIEFSARDPLSQADTVAVMERLDSTPLAPNFGSEDDDGAELADVAAFLQSLTGVNFVISSKVREELDEEETLINLQLPERSVRKILDIICETRENLRWKVSDGVVKFVTKEELLGGQVLRMYEVTDLIHPIPDFPGREINVSVSGGILLPEEDFEERESNVVTLDLLDQLIRNNIAPESWDEDPANNLRINEMGVMVVNQTPEVHKQIEQLLNDLREATGIMVDIQTRFLQVEDNFLEDIGVDFRGLGQPGLGTNEFLNDFGDTTTQGELGQEIGSDTSLGAFLDEGGDGDLRARTEQLYDTALGDEDVLTGAGGLSFQWTYLNDAQLELILRAVSKSERNEIVTAPRLLVSNTGRANLTVLNQVVYVKDFDVEIAQAASIADPIIDVVQDGVILDVRPVVSADRRYITLELRPTIATLQRPIREAVTTLGSQNSVTIQLPELDIQRVRTSIPMPDGSTVLLGGLKIHENKDQRSGVPIVNKIPIVSMFFQRSGNYTSSRKLLILLKADIVIPAEHEPTAAQLGF